MCRWSAFGHLAADFKHARYNERISLAYLEVMRTSHEIGEIAYKDQMESRRRRLTLRYSIFHPLN